jgi:peroxiredoxin
VEESWNSFSHEIGEPTTLMKKKTLCVISASLTLFVACSAFAGDEDSAKVLKLDQLNEKAPALELVNPEGQVSHLSDYSGKRIILHFWASWCVPCQKELQDLGHLTQAGEKIRVKLLPVSADEVIQRKTAEKFLAAVPGQLPFFQAASGKDPYLTWGIPVTYFIDETGTILYRAMGPRQWSTQANLSKLLSQLFKINK